MKKVLLLLAFSISIIGLGAQPVNGLIGHYTFDNTMATDDSPVPLNGTNYGATCRPDRNNNHAHSMYFDGNDRVIMGHSAKLNTTTNGLTVSAWVNIPNVTGQKAIVSKWMAITSRDQFLLMISGALPVFAVGNPTNIANGVTGATPLTVNTWHHVAATWDTTGRHTIYVNGVLSSTTVLPQFNHINDTSTTSLNIGSQSNGVRKFAGRIDDVRIYDHALSAQEISDLFNEQTAAGYQDQIAAKYYFNDGDAHDEAMNPANGVVTGATLTEDRFGNPDHAYNFDGNGDYIRANPSLKLNMYSGLTISSWINLANVSGQKAIVSKWDNVTARDQYLLMASNNRLTMAVGNPTNIANGVTGATTLSANTWYHVVCTWDNTGAHKIYLNGNLDLSTTLPAFVTINDTATLRMYIGAQNPLNRVFNGKIDDVKIYHRALTAQEITDLYNEPDPMITGIVEPTATAQTLLVYPNPVQDELYFETQDRLQSVQIYNAMGQAVLKATFNAGNSVQVGTLEPGVYFAQVVGERGELISTRFVKH